MLGNKYHISRVQYNRLGIEPSLPVLVVRTQATVLLRRKIFNFLEEMLTLLSFFMS